MRLTFPALAAAAWLAACEAPPPGKYATSGGAAAGTKIDLGLDGSNVKCSGLRSPGDQILVFCGLWDEPFGRVAPAGPAAASDAMSLATSSPWRTGLNERMTCNAPAPTTILVDMPALTMQCYRRVGGWPEVAIVAVRNGQAWVADGVQPSFPVLQRAVGVASHRLTEQEAPAATAEGLDAARLAAASYSAGDIGYYDTLLHGAARANLEEDYSDAAVAYRRAAELLQNKSPKNPEVAVPLMAEALQLSNMGQDADAEKKFDEAQALIDAAHGRLSDPAAPARLQHYRGIALLNAGKPEAALANFHEAEAAYAMIVPEALPVTGGDAAERSGDASSELEKKLAASSLTRSPADDEAILGFIESQRYEAIALKQLGRQPEASRKLADLANLVRPLNASSTPSVRALNARLLRTFGQLETVSGNQNVAERDFAESATDFERSLPQSRPVAVTNLLRAAALQRQARSADALSLCVEAKEILKSRDAGIPSELMAPCLDAFLDVAKGDPTHAQALLAQAFEAAERIQGGLTSQEIATAAATLQESKLHPEIADAFRKRNDARDNLEKLERERDVLLAASTTDPQIAVLTTRIGEAEKQVREATEAVEASDETLPQLVQKAVSAAQVQQKLDPEERFAAIVLTRDRGWTFILTGDRIWVASIEHGERAVAPLVSRLRASVERRADGTLPDFDVAASRQLYDLLFAGLAPAMVGARRLVVAPSGSLLSIPFSILLAGPTEPARLAEAPFLVRQMAISHVPSAANFVSLRAIAGGSKAPWPWFGFGDFHEVTPEQAARSFPTGECADSAKLLAGLEPLPGTRTELEQARSILHAGADAQLLGQAFTAKSVLGAHLGDYRILHFATHALLPTDLKCETEPAIVTSAPAGSADAWGALLTASDVQSLHLDAEAVILSACNTAGPTGTSSDGKRGESLSGLARSFFHAGARNLVVTHWEADDQYAPNLITLTLLFHKQGQDLPEALAEAERKLLDQAKTDTVSYSPHPYYWAPFAVIGADRAHASG